MQVDSLRKSQQKSTWIEQDTFPSSQKDNDTKLSNQDGSHDKGASHFLYFKNADLVHYRGLCHSPLSWPRPPPHGDVHVVQPGRQLSACVSGGISLSASCPSFSAMPLLQGLLCCIEGFPIKESSSLATLADLKLFWWPSLSSMNGMPVFAWLRGLGLTALENHWQ